MRLDVEDDLLDLAGERERLAVLVGEVDDPAVVAADVHPGIAREADRTVCSIRPSPTGRSSMNSVTSPPVAGFAASAANTIRTVTSPSGSASVGLLAEDEDAHHRVGVGELAVVDEEREPAQVVGLGDDHTLGAARRGSRGRR